MNNIVENTVLFEIMTPIGLSVRCSRNYWSFISETKHPAMKGKLEEVKNALTSPSEVRRSSKDSDVYLFYRGEKPRWVCVVCKDDKGLGFVVTAYPTSAIKAGEQIWKK